MGSEPHGSRALTRSEVAAMLAISQRHLRRLEELHRIPVLRLGRSVRYEEAAVAALKDACRVAPASPLRPSARSSPFPTRALLPPKAAAAGLAARLAKAAGRKAPS